MPADNTYPTVNVRVVESDADPGNPYPTVNIRIAVTELDGAAHSVLYVNGAGDVAELPLGPDGTFLKSNGADQAPTFVTPAGAGDVYKIGTPVDGQVGVWTGAGTLEGDAALTFDTSTDTFTTVNIAPSGLVDGRDVAADGTKLDGVEAAADVTDTANVTAAGALMDSELADISAIKTLQAPDNTTISTFGASIIDDADEATFKATVNLEIGVDVQAYAANLTAWAGLAPSANAQSLVTAANYAAMRTLLDLEVGTDFLSPAAIAAAYQPLDSDLTTIAGLTATTDNFMVAVGSAWASRTPAQVRTTLNVEDGADVTDTANVTAAGALMDSEVDADIKTLTLPAGTTISAFGATLVDDASASAARTTLGVAIGVDVAAYDATVSIGTWVAVSGSPTEIDFTGLVAGAKYVLHIDGIGPATNDSSLRLRVQTGGSTWETTGYAYAAVIAGAGGTPAGYGSTFDSLTTSIGLSQKEGTAVAVGNAAGETWTGEVTFTPGQSSSYRAFDFTGGWYRSGGSGIWVSGRGTYGSSVAITGVRLLLSTGAFANVGRYKLERIG